MKQIPCGPRNDLNADWAPSQGDFPDDLHGNTRGKRYQFKPDGRCPECLVEACERQQAGGFARELPRGARLLGRLTVLQLRPACGDPDYAFQDDWTHSWTLYVHKSGHST